VDLAARRKAGRLSSRWEKGKLHVKLNRLDIHAVVAIE
jgi:hypothetical protein